MISLKGKEGDIQRAYAEASSEKDGGDALRREVEEGRILQEVAIFC